MTPPSVPVDSDFQRLVDEQTLALASEVESTARPPRAVACSTAAKAFWRH